ncbi:unnamed protein product [Scytosiphon promiscuus]
MTVPAFLVPASHLYTHCVPAASWCQRVPAGRHPGRTRPRRLELRQLMSTRQDDAEDDRGDRTDLVEPTLEQSYEAIDDVYLDRLPGEGRDKVKIFGAWLDADIAGRKAGQGNRAAGLIARVKNGEELTDEEKAEIFYEEAITVMKRRDCDASVTLLETAVELAGADSRRGGEFKLWAAQALQGVGRNKQAVEVLKSLKGHRDLDVRKVGAELLYIAQAPRLALNGEDFVEFPDVSQITEVYDKKEIRKPKVVPWKNPEKEKDMFAVGADTGQAPGNDPIMLLAAIASILGLSYVFLG